MMPTAADLFKVPLTVEGDTTTPDGGRLVFVDYTKNPRACRSGVWVGWEDLFTETVTIGWEHPEVVTDPDGEEGGVVNVGWYVNGVDIHIGGHIALNQPCPGMPS